MDVDQGPFSECDDVVYCDVMTQEYDIIVMHVKRITAPIDALYALSYKLPNPY